MGFSNGVRDHLVGKRRDFRVVVDDVGVFTESTLRDDCDQRIVCRREVIPNGAGRFWELSRLYPTARG